MSSLRVLAQSFSESLLTTDNAYNPMPSPDGKHIAYVRVGWGESIFVSMGRSSLVSEFKVIDTQGGDTSQLLAKPFFLSGWTPESTRLICFRDGNYAVISMAGEQVETGHVGNTPRSSERVVYSPSRGRVVEEASFGSGRAVPSADGRYVATFGDNADSELTIHDLVNRSSKSLGRMSIHPDRNWSYIQPDWNPWFADSSRLVFLRDSTLVIVTPDGSDKTEIEIQGQAGLPTPSPDVQSIAYATFEPHPMKVRTDLQFWGGTTIMVVSASAGSKPRPITLKNPDEVYDLKWLNNSELVFDRVADEMFYQHARIWRAAVPR
jgi:Tol biopolymer transport system component